MLQLEAELVDTCRGLLKYLHVSNYGVMLHWSPTKTLFLSGLQPKLDSVFTFVLPILYFLTGFKSKSSFHLACGGNPTVTTQ